MTLSWGAHRCSPSGELAPLFIYVCIYIYIYIYILLVMIIIMLMMIIIIIIIMMIIMMIIMIMIMIIIIPDRMRRHLCLSPPSPHFREKQQCPSKPVCTFYISCASTLHCSCTARRPHVVRIEFP